MFILVDDGILEPSTTGVHAMTTMQDLIKQADANRPEGGMYSQANADTSVGFIRCFRDYSVYKRGTPSSIRTNWRLNDKVISAVNLAKLLSNEPQE